MAPGELSVGAMCAAHARVHAWYTCVVHVRVRMSDVCIYASALDVCMYPWSYIVKCGAWRAFCGCYIRSCIRACVYVECVYVCMYVSMVFYSEVRRLESFL